MPHKRCWLPQRRSPNKCHRPHSSRSKQSRWLCGRRGPQPLRQRRRQLSHRLLGACERRSRKLLRYKRAHMEHGTCMLHADHCLLPAPARVVAEGMDSVGREEAWGLAAKEGRGEAPQDLACIGTLSCGNWSSPRTCACRSREYKSHPCCRLHQAQCTPRREHNQGSTSSASGTSTGQMFGTCQCSNGQGRVLLGVSCRRTLCHHQPTAEGPLRNT